MLKVVRAQIAAGADVIKMYGATGTGRDLTGFHTFTYKEIKAGVDAAHARGKKFAIHTTAPIARGTPSAPAPIPSSTPPEGTMLQSPRWPAARPSTRPPSITTGYCADSYRKLNYRARSVDELKAFVQRNLEIARKAFRAGVRFAMGSDAVYTMFGENTASWAGSSRRA